MEKRKPRKAWPGSLRDSSVSVAVMVNALFLSLRAAVDGGCVKAVATYEDHHTHDNVLDDGWSANKR
jgi:hypothetical protein